MDDLEVVVSVSDKYLWALAPFAYLFNKYWDSSVRVTVAGYSPPYFALPQNFTFYSIDVPGYPKDRWVDGFTKFLNQYNKYAFVLMLEDYWTCRKVNVNGVRKLADYIFVREDCLRIDLTGDRLYAGGMKDIGYFGEYDIVEAPKSPYQMSLQAGIWNRNLLLKVLLELPKDKHSAWDVELEGTGIVDRNDLHVVGTRQWPVRYVNGKNDTKPEINLNGFIMDDIKHVKEIVSNVIRST